MSLRQAGLRRDLGRVAQWLLFLGLLIGVAAMHTFGHADGGGHMVSMPAVHSASTGHHNPAGHHTAAPESAVHPLSALPTGLIQMTDGIFQAPDGAEVDSASICLAILAGMLLLRPLGGAVMWMRREPRSGVMAAFAWSAHCSGLPPPRSPELPVLSVLRL